MDDLKKIAEQKDSQDPLASFRKKFHFPVLAGREALYFCGNSLGLQPKTSRAMVEQELTDWERLGVLGHHKKDSGWFGYHELLTDDTAALVGAHRDEVINMNALTVNLHLLMVSFFRPRGKKRKILIEAGAFPSDQYAVETQLSFHNLDPKEDLIIAQPRSGERTLRTEDILDLISKRGDEIALVMMGGVHYLTGQVMDMAVITQAAHAKDCLVGFDCAHAAGNLALQLHDWNVDFAAWCSYKYLNAGPGGLSGCFVHRNRIAEAPVRFAGWWGHNKEKRFLMEPGFDPVRTAEGWQISNPPILQAAALRASLAIFREATMPALRKKSVELTGFLETLLREHIADKIRVITPTDSKHRGAQLSLQFAGDLPQLQEKLQKKGIVVDLRQPDIMRVAPAPLYNSFHDVYEFALILKESLR